MKKKLTSLFFIKVLFLSCYCGYSQEKERDMNDTIIKNNKYGLRIGIDLADLQCLYLMKIFLVLNLWSTTD